VPSVVNSLGFINRLNSYKIFKNQTIIEQINTYLADFQADKQPFKRIHKNKLHATLSFTDDYVGSKLGETVKMDGYDLESS
jgi:2'-5' RNA ligase